MISWSKAKHPKYMYPTQDTIEHVLMHIACHTVSPYVYKGNRRKSTNAYVSGYTFIFLDIDRILPMIDCMPGITREEFNEALLNTVYRIVSREKMDNIACAAVRVSRSGEGYHIFYITYYPGPVSPMVLRSEYEKLYNLTTGGLIAQLRLDLNSPDALTQNNVRCILGAFDRTACTGAKIVYPSESSLMLIDSTHHSVRYLNPHNAEMHLENGTKPTAIETLEPKDVKKSVTRIHYYAIKAQQVDTLNTRFEKSNDTLNTEEIVQNLITYEDTFIYKKSCYQFFSHLDVRYDRCEKKLKIGTAVIPAPTVEIARMLAVLIQINILRVLKNKPPLRICYDPNKPYLAFDYDPEKQRTPLDFYTYDGTTYKCNTTKPIEALHLKRIAELYGFKKPPVNDTTILNSRILAIALAIYHDAEYIHLLAKEGYEDKFNEALSHLYKTCVKKRGHYVTIEELFGSKHTSQARKRVLEGLKKEGIIRCERGKGTYIVPGIKSLYRLRRIIAKFAKPNADNYPKLITYVGILGYKKRKRYHARHVAQYTHTRDQIVQVLKNNQVIPDDIKQWVLKYPKAVKRMEAFTLRRTNNTRLAIPIYLFPVTLKWYEDNGESKFEDAVVAFTRTGYWVLKEKWYEKIITSRIGVKALLNIYEKGLKRDVFADHQGARIDFPLSFFHRTKFHYTDLERVEQESIDRCVKRCEKKGVEIPKDVKRDPALFYYCLYYLKRYEKRFKKAPPRAFFDFLNYITHPDPIDAAKQLGVKYRTDIPENRDLVTYAFKTFDKVLEELSTPNDTIRYEKVTRYRRRLGRYEKDELIDLLEVYLTPPDPEDIQDTWV